MSALYCNNGCPYERIGKCPESGLPERCGIQAMYAELARYRRWVDDLQSGMYVTCVYCGHRYGPEDKVPASMAEALKQHVEQCPKHPMSALKAELTAVKAERDAAILDVRRGWPCAACQKRVKGREGVRCDHIKYRVEADEYASYCEAFEWRGVQPERSGK